MVTDVAGGIVGSSRAIAGLRGYIAKLARSDANVLITGETGTGKECIAEAIHAASPRARHPLVSINCAAVPDGLVESELFGYERGAFTGAQGAYPGKLRLADGGTVFLDEIGEMSTYVQVKILRVLETRRIFPLGAMRESRVDVRFIAASNQDLEPLIVQRQFRSDLYYRLNVAQLHVPPLRERKEDVPELLAHFLAFFSAGRFVTMQAPAPDLMRCLMAYHWPGNVRELRNLAEALLIDPPAGPISLSDVPESFRRVFAAHANVEGSERDRLLSLLNATNWNKSKAAAQMHWSRMTLYRKMSKHKIGSR